MPFTNSSFISVAKVFQLFHPNVGVSANPSNFCENVFIENKTFLKHIIKSEFYLLIFIYVLYNLL